MTQFPSTREQIVTTRPAIELLLYTMDCAFEGDPSDTKGNWHALLVNLGSLRDQDWLWLPPGGSRTVFSLVQELGQCKHVYANQAFGDRSMRWDKPGSVPEIEAGKPIPQVLDWLRDAQKHLRDHVSALQDDSELLRPRLSPQGWQRETRWIINTMIQHDIYHAGEINHLRALAQGND